jgi:hypothetical protein
MRTQARVQWRRPDAVGPSSRSVSGQPGGAVISEGSPPSRAPRRTSARLRGMTGVERAVATYGVPYVPGAKTAAQEAMMLLEMAAEIEQSLMVQYLYAAFSAKDAAVSGVLRRIAIEEMGHLLSVQNLRIALGGQPYFGRQDQSPQPDADPFPFRLQPLHNRSLARFTAAEAPALETFGTGAEADALRKELKEISKVAGIEAGVPIIHRIGLVYMRLYYLFQPDDNPIEPWPAAAEAKDWSSAQRYHIDANDFARSPRVALQGAEDEWPVGSDAQLLGNPVATTAEARQLIFSVSAQGEGPNDGADTHFRFFRKLYRDATQPGGQLAVHPVLDSEMETIDAEPAATLSRLFDLRYELLLINLQQMLSTERAEPELARRQQFADWSRREMKHGLGGLASLLLTLPRHPGTDAATAPASSLFHMPALHAPHGKAEQWKFLLAALDQADALAKLLSSVPGIGPKLVRLKALDTERRAELAALPP